MPLVADGDFSFIEDYEDVMAIKNLAEELPGLLESLIYTNNRAPGKVNHNHISQKLFKGILARNGWVFFSYQAHYLFSYRILK